MAISQNKRETWSSKVDFILTCIGWCVGLGNVWRFPYLCYKNGGGAFLIPYVAALLLCALPVMCLEFFMGQYAGMGTLSFWNFCPLMKGVGYAILSVNIVISIYYMFIIALSLWYTVASMSSTLPWATCGNPWNTPQCRDFGLHISKKTLLPEFNSEKNYSEVMSNISSYQTNVTAMLESVTYTSPAEEYFRYGVLNISDGIGEIGAMSWKLALCSLVCWIFVPLANIRGIKSAGKVVYFTALYPYVMLTILVIRGCTLPGSMQGLIFYLKPDWSMLQNSQVWFSAAMQVYFSLGVGQGVTITLVSYNPLYNPCIRDALITGIVNCCTSVYSGFAVFSILGYMAHEYDMEVSDVVASGSGLAFVVYPQALATLPLAPLWSVCFFIMLITLGIDSQMVKIEVIITCLRDEFSFFKGEKKRVMLNVIFSTISFLSGLIFVTRGGFYYFTLVDWYGTTFTLYVVAFSECICLYWVFGWRNLCECYQVMFGRKPNWCLRICWSVISPVFIFIILVLSIIKFKAVTLGTYEFPVMAQIAGYGLLVMSLLPIPILAAYTLITADGESILQRFQKGTTPSTTFQQHVKERIIEANSKKSDEPDEEEEDMI